jgi:hypothetical protein
LFCSGVPVSSRRFGVSKSRTTVRELGVLVLDAVRLVDDRGTSSRTWQSAASRSRDLVRGETTSNACCRDELFGDEGGALLFVAVELEHAAAREPLVELAIPVAERRLGHNDDVRAGDAARLGLR